ncbi:MAG: hypothetical protein LVQ95_01870 [Candidatus Micrarchaeales archaeon]|nr:hypothetical protein [Candidatus Micrarchaeales archaeon]
MSATDVANMPEQKSARAPMGRDMYPDTKAYKEVVATLLEKCQTPADVYRFGKELRYRGGWREEYELHRQAEKKFPEEAEGFANHRANMAANRIIKPGTGFEVGRVTPEELLRVGAEA